jgi:hypothetical protein
VIKVNVGWCGGGFTLDWVSLRDFSSNFEKNWSAVNSLVVKDRYLLLGGGCGAVIASKTAMFNRGEFWEV